MKKIKPQESGIEIRIHLDDFEKVLKIRSFELVLNDAMESLTALLFSAKNKIKK